jgi:hypothetical protein
MDKTIKETMAQKTTHEKTIDYAKDRLKKMSKQELLFRRALLDAAIREAEKRKIPWKELAEDDDPRLTVEEQYDLINEALFNLDPDPGKVVNFKAGKAFTKTFKQGA